MTEPIRFLDAAGEPRYVSTGNPLPTTGSGGGGGGGAVTVADGADTAQGTTTQTAAASDGTGNYSLIQAAKRGLLNWASLLAKIPTLTVTSTRLLVDGSGVTQPVSDAGASLTVDGRSASGVVTFNRPSNTTAYTAGDVVGSATTANHQVTSAGVSGSLIQVLSASLKINLTSVPSGMTSFRIHLWDAAPTAIADNAAFSAAAGDRASYCGFIDLATIVAIGGGFLFIASDYVGRPIRLTATSFYFNLVANGGWTPASGTEHSVRFHLAEVGA